MTAPSCHLLELTNISLLESRRVVDTIPSDSHNLSLSLTAFYNDQLLLGWGTSKHNFIMVVENLVNLVRCHITKISTMNNSSFSVPENNVQYLLKLCRNKTLFGWKSCTNVPQIYKSTQILTKPMLLKMDIYGLIFSIDTLHINPVWMIIIYKWSVNIQAFS